MEGAIAIAQKNAGAVGAIIRGDDVEFTIAINIAQSHAVGIFSGSEGLLGLEGTIAITQENAYVAGVIICGDDIEISIAVHIAHGNARW